MLIRTSAATVLAALIAAIAAAPSGASRHDWPTFGVDASRSGVFHGPAGIRRRDLRRLHLRRVRLPGTVDSSPLYLHALAVAGRRRDVYVMTTSYGITLAVDASSGRLLWRHDPAGVGSLLHSSRFTESTPVADPERRFVYTTGPDGLVHKLALASGREQGGAWPVAITRDPVHEKVDAPLTLAGRYVYGGTTSYFDRPPYVGHLVAIDRGTGSIAGVLNAVCATRREIILPTDCPQSGGSVWARAGAVIEPGSGRVLVTLANAPWNGVDAFGETVLELTPDLSRRLQGWTPRNQAALNGVDFELGSTAPALVRYRGRRLAVQGGKDARLRLLDVAHLGGSVAAPPRTGGELETVALPRHAGLYSAPAVSTRGGRSTIFVATPGATVAYRVAGPRPHLKRLWYVQTAGTSPVIAGGLLYVYDYVDGRLYVRDPASGARLAVLGAATGHFSSPVVADGRIALTTGAAYRRQTSGWLYIWRR